VSDRDTGKVLVEVAALGMSLDQGGITTHKQVRMAFGVWCHGGQRYESEAVAIVYGIKK
jgi:hypothetical protein